MHDDHGELMLASEWLLPVLGEENLSSFSCREFCLGRIAKSLRSPTVSSLSCLKNSTLSHIMKKSVPTLKPAAKRLSCKDPVPLFCPSSLPSLDLQVRETSVMLQTT
eukprot:TRINITY_DN5473_c0_g1_i10.p1 TRINITY_DN5473_c0_g1~~TRINITY_DN5473_c0_g1_i10.p1  ORF type:complete len:107 (+),score=22.29 TRINITY_DN5473_c0_g1_i10:668-988(+)